MLRIEDMSEPHRQSWITLLADSAVFIWFWKNMTGGFNFTPRDMEPSEAGAFFLQLVIVTIILHAVIAAVFEMRKRKVKFEKDERDIDIARRGSHAGYGLLQLGIGIILVTLLIQYVVGGDYQGPVSVIEPVQMLFVLCFASYVADIYRHGTIIWAYRH